MKRWNNLECNQVENAKVDDFLAEIIEVCKKHGFSIGHEDTHGAFEIEVFSQNNAEWLLNANDSTGF